jgi:hypothetical protein
MSKKFDGKDGKVVFIDIEQLSSAYPEGTLKVEVNIYPVGQGRYSSFIYSNDTVSFIENSFSKIAERFLTDGKSSYHSQEISDSLTIDLIAIFPKKQD